MSDGLTVPRSKSGRRFHRYGDSARAVVIDSDGQEASDSHDGQVWIAIAPDVTNFLFVDERGGNTSHFIATRSVRNAQLGVFVDGDLVHTGLVPGLLAKGARLNVDWSEMYEGMR